MDQTHTKQKFFGVLNDFQEREGVLRAEGERAVGREHRKGVVWRRRWSFGPKTQGKLSVEAGLGGWHEFARGGGTQEGAWKSLVTIAANSGRADSETPQGPGEDAAWCGS